LGSKELSKITLLAAEFSLKDCVCHDALDVPLWISDQVRRTSSRRFIVFPLVDLIG
jgi:hypothetical protein